MAGVWCVSPKFAKRIRGFGNAVLISDRIRRDHEFIYEIRPID
jgi:hypothetical protein